MIEKVTIAKLRGISDIEVNFFDDVNIITGINGVGKTTFLKLLWYVYSGNLSRAIKEVEFNEVEIITKTHLFRLFKSKPEKVTQTHSGYDMYVREKESGAILLDTANLEETVHISKCEDLVSKINKTSLFFPTFRRIEGFSNTNNNKSDYFYIENEEQIIDEAMKKISNLLSLNDHKYVTSVATKDIIELITTKYANISDKINSKYKSLSDDIQSTINNSREYEDNLNLRDQLNKIKEFVDENNLHREQALSPINKINELVDDIFHRKGINIGDKMFLGATKEKIDSQFLSAGEKQMLSFISYNAFYHDVPIIIDEPEISLHTDWQRRLLSILKSQRTHNQLIVATHSPFIYSKYSDKEIFLEEEELSLYGI